MKKILITGGSGLVGNILSKHLSNKYEIRILDQNDSSFESIVGDISNLESIKKAFHNIHTVIHLAGDRRVHGDWSSILNNNDTPLAPVPHIANVFLSSMILFKIFNNCSFQYL